MPCPSGCCSHLTVIHELNLPVLLVFSSNNSIYSFPFSWQKLSMAQALKSSCLGECGHMYPRVLGACPTLPLLQAILLKRFPSAIGELLGDHSVTPCHLLPLHLLAPLLDLPSCFLVCLMSHFCQTCFRH